MNYNMKNFFIVFLPRVFTRVNISKVLVIFLVGFLCRVFINSYWDINVFVEYLSIVSIAFYSYMAGFVVFINELFSFFNISIIPRYILEFFTNLFSMFVTSCTLVSHFKFEYLKISFIKRISIEYLYTISNSSKLYLFGDCTEQEQVNSNRNVQKFDVDLNSKDNLISCLDNNSSKSKGSPNSLSDNSQWGNNSSLSDKSHSVRRIKKLDSLSDSYKLDNVNMDKGKGKEVNSVIGSSSNEIFKGYGVEDNTSKLILFHADIFSEYAPTPSSMNSDNTGYNTYRNNNALHIPLSKPNLGSNLSTPSDLTPVSNFFPSLEDIGGDNTSNKSAKSIISVRSDISKYGSNNSTSNSEVLAISSHLPILPPNQDIVRISSYTNETNHATVGSKSNTPVNWGDRRDLVRNNIQQVLIDFSEKEVVLSTPTSKGKFRLGFKLIDNNLDKIEQVYVKYHDISKRKLYWKLWEKGRGNYSTYAEFKSEFDTKTNIWKEIFSSTKSDVSKEVTNLIRSNDPFRVNRLDGINHRRVYQTPTQTELNRINSNKNYSSSRKTSVSSSNKRLRDFVPKK